MLEVLPEGPVASSCAPAAATPVVLVVDDEMAVRGVLDIALRRAGFEVRLASSGEEAVALYRGQPAGINLVLMDVRMPGLSGPDTLDMLRKVDPRVRCCFMSGDLGNYTEEDLLDRGAAYIFRKPFALPELPDVLRQLC